MDFLLSRVFGIGSHQLKHRGAENTIEGVEILSSRLIENQQIKCRNLLISMNNRDRRGIISLVLWLS